MSDVKLPCPVLDVSTKGTIREKCNRCPNRTPTDYESLAREVDALLNKQHPWVVDGYKMAVNDIAELIRRKAGK